MKPWQEYLLSKFPKDEYVDIPAWVVDLVNMWRHATWEKFISDTLDCNGTQMAALLSMAYKPKVIVEMGVDAGFTTLQFCKLNPDARVYGIDNRSQNSNTKLPIGFHVLMNNVSNLTLAIMNSWDFSMPGKVDLCFIDAEHCGEAPWKDTLRAWDNRNTLGDWCIAWDDYHPNNPDVFGAVNRFVTDVKMDLQQVGSWVFIGTIPATELRNYGGD